MRLLITLCIALIARISYPTIAADQSLDGFQETRWGMTEDQIQEVYHGKLEHWTKISGGANGMPINKFPLFGLQHYDIDQCDFSVTFDLTEKRLSKVTLSLNDMTRLGCPRTITDILTRKYGAPGIDEPSKNQYSEIHARTWFVGNTMVREIDVFWAGVGNFRSKNMLVIYYEPTQTSGAKKLSGSPAIISRPAADPARMDDFRPI